MPNTPTTNVGLNKPAQGDTPWDATINGNWDKVDSLFGSGSTAPSITATHLIAVTDFKLAGGTTLVGQTGTGTSIVTNNAPTIAGSVTLSGSIGSYNGSATAGQGVEPI